MTINHGDMLGENLYFCIYTITLANVSSFIKLARAAGGCSPMLDEFHYSAEALGCSFEEASKKYEQAGLQVQEKKYISDGAVALIQVLGQFERNVRSYNTDESSCYLACFSAKKPNKQFDFTRDVTAIEMIISITSAPRLDYVIHLGIQRSIVYTLANNPIHPNIAMLLHGCAAQYISQHYPEKKFMITNPLPKMEEIFKKTMGEESLFIIKNRALNPLREELHLDYTSEGELYSREIYLKCIPI
jgi:hypothetical protein